MIHGVVLNLKARHWSGTKSEVRPSGLFEKAHQDIQDGASNVNICLSVFLEIHEIPLIREFIEDS